MTRKEQLADFLAITHSDCNLISLPEVAPPMSGQATQHGYLWEADRILGLLGLDPDHPAKGHVR